MVVPKDAVSYQTCLCTAVQGLRGTHCWSKATPVPAVQSSGPEAVGALTQAMRQPQETERRALALRLHHVIGRDRRLGRGAVSLDTLSENAQNAHNGG